MLSRESTHPIGSMCLRFMEIGVAAGEACKETRAGETTEIPRQGSRVDVGDHCSTCY